MDATSDATSDAITTATMAAITTATRAATMAAITTATRAATMAATAAATSAATMDATSTQKITLTKWFRLGGCEISDMLDIGDQFLPEEKSLMAECAAKSWKLLNGGNQWSGWVAYLSFFRHISKLDIDYSKWDHYENAAIHSGPRYMHEKFCIVSDRPETLLVNVQNLPHCLAGPFCRWRDGSALYAVNGVRIPRWIIERKDLITPERIDAEQNAEIRRAMIEIYGQAKYLKDNGANLIHKDKFGELYQKELAGDEPLTMVKVRNSTPEKDGTVKDYFLRVPPGMKTAHEAVAWGFGMKPSEYSPEVET